MESSNLIVFKENNLNADILEAFQKTFVVYVACLGVQNCCWHTYFCYRKCIIVAVNVYDAVNIRTFDKTKAKTSNNSAHLWADCKIILCVLCVYLNGIYNVRPTGRDKTSCNKDIV